MRSLSLKAKYLPAQSLVEENFIVKNFNREVSTFPISN